MSGEPGDQAAEHGQPDRAREHHDEEREIERDPADPDRSDPTPQPPQRRVGHGVHGLGHDESDPARLPVPGEHLDPVEDEPDQHRDDEQQQQEVGDREEPPHTSAAQLWLKKRACVTSGSAASAAISTEAGDSRNTLLVTRSIAPRSPNTRPAEKSTSRFASASLMSLRFMMTGVPARNASPITFASL